MFRIGKLILLPVILRSVSSLTLSKSRFFQERHGNKSPEIYNKKVMQRKHVRTPGLLVEKNPKHRHKSCDSRN